MPITLWGRHLYANWVVDYMAAFALGIVFQYFAIRPMRQMSRTQAWLAALKADSASLTAWQIGMYGWMAICVFLIFDSELPQTDPVFWFMMQLGMLAGFVTAFPVNWWLVSAGIKERM